MTGAELAELEAWTMAAMTASVDERPDDVRVLVDGLDVEQLRDALTLVVLLAGQGMLDVATALGAPIEDVLETLRHMILTALSEDESAGETP